MKTVKYPIRRACLFAALGLALQSCATSTAARGQEPVDPPTAEVETETADGGEPSSREPYHGSLKLGFGGAGLCFGNSASWDGLRINFRDHGVERVRGVNLTLWSSRSPALERFDGLAVGVAPVAGRSRGVSLGLATVAEESMAGAQLGLLATVSQGTLAGVSAGGLAVVAQGDMRGISVGGLAVVSEGRMRGVNAGGLAVVTEGSLRGLNLGGLAVVTEGGARGLNLGGLAVVSEGEQWGIGIAGLAHVTESAMYGVSVAGLATVAGDRFQGLGVSGLATVCEGDFKGVGLAGLSVGAGDFGFRDLAPTAPPSPDRDTSATGVMLAGYRVQANRIKGIAGAILVTRAHEMSGLAFGAYNGVSGRQTGASVGIFNYATELRGIQIGLLNYVGDNPRWLRWLPLVNARF